METESRRESATYIHEENIPRIHAKPKVTRAIKSTIINHDHCNNIYRCPHLKSYDMKKKWQLDAI